MAAPTLTAYRTSVLNGQPVVLACYSDGSTQKVSELPPGVTIARKGGLIRLPYSPEAKGVYTPEQFGQDKNYDPNFRYILDWNPGAKSVAMRKRIGVNAFNHWTLSDQEKAALAYGEGILYLTESGLHGPMEGRGIYEATLSDYENYIWNHIPTCGSGADPGVKLVILNIEKSLGWGRGSYSDSEWTTKKTQSIFLESTGQTVSYDTLNTSSGLWASESLTRAQNRFVILMEALKKKAAESVTPRTDLEVVYGASMYQGEPRLDFVNNTGIFIEGSVNISHISGASGSTITFTGSGYSRTYTNISGSIWDHESSMQGYYYRFGKDFLEVDGKAIFEDKVPATQNYTYLWSKILPRHIVADEKGYIQLNEKRMRERQGKTRPIIRQIEPQYESDFTGLIGADGTFKRSINVRNTFPELQPSVTGNGEAPKIWQAPGDNYSRYCVIRLRAGAEKGWGLYLFPPDDVSKINLSISANPIFNHELHAITALDQARADMQRFERWWAGSTYVEDPEVQINGSGPFTAYSGTEAYAYSDGTFGTPKPAFMLRWKDEGTSWRIVFVGGMKQGFTDETSAVLRVPGGLLNGNRFSVKLIGPYAHVFEVVVQKADIGQTYEVLPVVNTDWLKPGYAARTAATASSGSGGGSGSSGGSGGGSAAVNKPSFDSFDYSPILTNPTWTEYDTRLHRGVPIGDKIVLDNGIIRVEIWKNFGGAPGHISASGQPNIINQNDWGRGAALTIYRGGRTRQVEADNKEIQTQWAQAWGTTADGGGVGNNPIQIGDTFDNPSVVIQVGRSGNRVYTKSIMMNWAVRNEPTDVILEQWVEISGAECDVHVKLTHNRTMDQTAYEARSNEYPNVIVNAPYKYNAHVDSSGNVVYLTNWNQTPVPMKENWYAVVPENNIGSQGLGVWRDGGYSTSHKRYAPDDTASGEFDNPANYSVSNQSIIWDWNGIYYTNHKFRVGTVQQIRDWANALPTNRNKLSWKFNARNGRGYFHYGNGRDTGYPTPDTGIEISPINGGSFVDIHWPKVSIPVSQLDKLYVCYKGASGWPANLILKAGTVGQTSTQYDGQQASATLICDNTYRIATFNLAGISGLTGNLQNLQLTALSVPTGAKLSIAWVNTASTDPEP